jgi:acyl-CoA thioesterase FadM
MSHRMTAGGEARLVGDVQTVLVTYDYQAARPVPVPPEWRRLIGAYEGQAFDIDASRQQTAAAS